MLDEWRGVVGHYTTLSEIVARSLQEIVYLCQKREARLKQFWQYHQLPSSRSNMRLYINIIVASITIGLFEDVRQEPQGIYLVLDLQHLRFTCQRRPFHLGSTVGEQEEQRAGLL